MPTALAFAQADLDDSIGQAFTEVAPPEMRRSGPPTFGCAAPGSQQTLLRRSFSCRYPTRSRKTDIRCKGCNRARERNTSFTICLKGQR
eukprot:symbB.v1.2.026096.t1/scaffold2583.1/size75752/5